MRLLLRIGVLAIVILASQAKEARAQSGVAQAVYGDLRDVIEELIRTEITTNVVARVRKRSPALDFYFNRTLLRLESSYWGNLSAKLEADLIVLVGDYVYWSISPSATTGGPKKNAKVQHFLSCFAEDRLAPGCEPMVPLQKKDRRSLVDRNCRSLDKAAKPGNDLACNLALATRSGLKKQSSMAIRHVIDAVTDILLRDLRQGPTKRRMRQMAQNWLGNIEEFPTEFPDLFLSVKTDPNLVTKPWIKKLCQKAALPSFFLGPANSAAWICFAVSYAGLPNALAFRVRIELPKNDGVISQYHRYWEVTEFLETLEDNPSNDARPYEQRLYGMFVNTTMREFCARNMALRPVKSAGPGQSATLDRKPGQATPTSICKGKKNDFGHPVGAKVTISWLDLEFTAKAVSNRFEPEIPIALARAVKSFRVGMERIQRMREVIPADLRNALFVEDRVSLEPAMQALRAFLRIGGLVAELRARWYLWPEDSELSGEERLRALDLGGLLSLALEGAAPAKDTSTETDDGSGIQKLLAGRSGLALRRILDLAFRADRRELAVEGVRLALGLKDRKSSPPYETFFLSLAGYLLDDSGKDSVTVTRESFRAAAKDLLRTLPSDGVPTQDEIARFRWLPLLSARIAFNENYRNEAGRAGRRSTVAADWPVAYLAISDYVGLRVSALDLIAPLSELALREVGEWDRERLLMLDLVRPRAGVWFAVPQLSRRLIIDAGIGLRLVGTDAPDGMSVGEYTPDVSAEVHVGISYAL